MFDGRVLGVDPGTAAVGLAAVESGPSGPTVLWAATLRTPAGGSASQRLLRIHHGVREAIERHRPGVVALERLMWGRNARSGMEVARASGAAMVAAAEAGLPVEEYAPLEVKMAVSGVGNASKETVRRALARVLSIERLPVEPDAADAVAVAVCHLQQGRLRRAVAGAQTPVGRR